MKSFFILINLFVAWIWEIVYYLKYQIKRTKYLAAFWHLINWAGADRRFTVIHERPV